MSSPNISAVVGDKAEVKLVVDDKHLAINVGSGDVPVFSTPSMIALMEKSATEVLTNKIDAAWTTVGTSINIKHLSATPKTIEVRAIATITALEGKKITYHIEAFDNKDKIGEGTHERFAVIRDKFLNNTNSKLQS